MATLAPRQEIYRASSRGVEVRLRVNPDSSWVVIRFPDREPFYKEFEQSEVAAVLARFKAIDGDPERFVASLLQ